MHKLIDVLETFYDKLDYGYEVENAASDDLLALMKLQIELFSIDNNEIESYLVHGKKELAAFLKQKAKEERALQEKLAAEARIREEEELGKRKEAAAQLLKELQEKLNHTLITNWTHNLNDTAIPLPNQAEPIQDPVMDSPELFSSNIENGPSGEIVHGEEEHASQNEQEDDADTPLHDEV